MRRRPTLSDAGVPRVPTFWRRRAQALAEPFEAVGQGEAGDVFDVLVAELPGNAHAKRSTESDGKLTAVHPEGDEGLRGARHRTCRCSPTTRVGSNGRQRIGPGVERPRGPGCEREARHSIRRYKTSLLRRR